MSTPPLAAAAAASSSSSSSSAAMRAASSARKRAFQMALTTQPILTLSLGPRTAGMVPPITFADDIDGDDGIVDLTQEEAEAEEEEDDGGAPVAAAAAMSAPAIPGRPRRRTSSSAAYTSRTAASSSCTQACKRAFITPYQRARESTQEESTSPSDATVAPN